MDIPREIRKAVTHFWRARSGQKKKQKPNADRGGRSAVTGGKQLDGFVDITQRIIRKAGIPANAIFTAKHLELPGYFRPEKKWDLVVVLNGHLLVAIEFKSQVGPSFGNNYNNRAEESIGNAQDIWTAYREGAFTTSHRPWLGYVMVLEDTEKSTKPVAVREPHFGVFEEFRDASYADRYSILLTKLVRERLYDSAALILTPKLTGRTAKYSEPDADLVFSRFIHGLKAHLSRFV